MKNFSLPTVLCKAVEGKPILKDEIRYLLGLESRDELELLRRTAHLVRSKHFGRKVFLYGFVYFSTHCRNNCSFCNFRVENEEAVRYRKSEDDVVQAAIQLRDSGVHLIDLTMGEDPVILHPQLGRRRLARIIKRVHTETGLPVMVSPGAVPQDLVDELAAAGAEWFALYQESHSPDLFEKLRPGQSYASRMEAKKYAGQRNMLIEEGILTGVGESVDDIAESIAAMRDMAADQVRVMSFVPQKNTPMETVKPAGNERELLIISILRLVMPAALIPASLDVHGLAGLQHRLLAGANVVTSIVPPGHNLNGVANSTLDIEEARRTVGSISSVLQFIGLEPATADQYRRWVEARLEGRGNPLLKGQITSNCRYWC